MASLIDDFSKEIECDYKGEHYSVRDNGAVMRHPNNALKPRPLDNKWTFGNFNTRNGYLLIGNERVHRIVATAFLGNDPSGEMVVDHIDTNKQNNRVENLRWVTKLENILLNPITVKKLELICGCTIEQILEDISILKDKALEPNIAWMHTVSSEEAKKALLRWREWSGQKTTKRKPPLNYSAYIRDPYYVSRYLIEPNEVSLEAYDRVLKKGLLFYNRSFKTSSVHNHVIISHIYDKSDEKIYVFCKSNDDVKPFHLEIISISNAAFKYERHSFLSVSGMDKFYATLKGNPWYGGDTIDDFYSQ